MHPVCYRVLSGIPGFYPLASSSTLPDPVVQALMSPDIAKYPLVGGCGDKQNPSLAHPQHFENHCPRASGSAIQLRMREGESKLCRGDNGASLRDGKNLTYSQVWVPEYVFVTLKINK